MRAATQVLLVLVPVFTALFVVSCAGNTPMEPPRSDAGDVYCDAADADSALDAVSEDTAPPRLDAADEDAEREDPASVLWETEVLVRMPLGSGSAFAGIESVELSVPLPRTDTELAIGDDTDLIVRARRANGQLCSAEVVRASDTLSALLRWGTLDDESATLVLRPPREGLRVPRSVDPDDGEFSVYPASIDSASGFEIAWGLRDWPRRARGRLDVELDPSIPGEIARFPELVDGVELAWTAPPPRVGFRDAEGRPVLGLMSYVTWDTSYPVLEGATPPRGSIDARVSATPRWAGYPFQVTSAGFLASFDLLPDADRVDHVIWPGGTLELETQVWLTEE